MTTPIGNPPPAVPLSNGGKASNPERALRDVSTRFEAMFVEALLAPMTKAMTGEATGSGAGGHVYRAMASEAMGETLAKGQSFGIADVLFRQLAAAAGVTSPNEETNEPIRLSRSHDAWMEIEP